MMRRISDDPDPTIEMTSGTNHDNPRPVTHVEVTEGKRTLGLCLAPIGDDKTEYQYCIDEAMKT